MPSFPGKVTHRLFIFIALHTMTVLWLAYDKCYLAMALGQSASNRMEVYSWKTLVMTIDLGEKIVRYLQNYQSYRFAAWYTANRGISDQEAMETLLLEWERVTSIWWPLMRYLRFLAFQGLR